MSFTEFKASFSRRSVRYLTVLMVATAAFSPVPRGDFVNWDDVLVTKNLALRGFTIEHLSGIIMPGFGGTYQPIRNLFFAVIVVFDK